MKTSRNKAIIYRKLQEYISHAYDDKVAGRIELDLWEQKTAGWKSEQERITSDIAALRNANTQYLHEGVKLMELASCAAELFKNAMTPDEKRQMLTLVLSNPQVNAGKVQFSYRKPFDLFVNVRDLEKWRAREDSNLWPSDS